jgi:16S rRNA G1207 methylase RsmC
MGEDHYFSAEPSSAVREREIAFMIAGHVFRLTTAAGVFSGERLDPGTAVLLRKAPPPGVRGGVHLDLGCGYGPIACVLAGTSPDARVYAVDVNNRALDLTRRNAEAAGLGDRIIACRPEDVPDDVRFDEIWSNPPIRVGKAELHALLLKWLPRLAPDGVAWLVVAKHLGADSLQTWLTAQGYPTERHASQSAFRILRVTSDH